jgi:hypothetical protein
MRATEAYRIEVIGHHHLSMKKTRFAQNNMKYKLLRLSYKKEKTNDN